MNSYQKKYFAKAKKQAYKSLEASGQFGLDITMAGERHRFADFLSQANHINRLILEEIRILETLNEP